MITERITELQLVHTTTTTMPQSAFFTTRLTAVGSSRGGRSHCPIRHHRHITDRCCRRVELNQARNTPSMRTILMRLSHRSVDRLHTQSRLRHCMKLRHIRSIMTRMVAQIHQVTRLRQSGRTGLVHQVRQPRPIRHFADGRNPIRQRVRHISEANPTRH